LLTGVLFGLAPFIHVSAIRVYETLKGASGRASASIASQNFRRALIIAQIAMAFLLVAGAGLLVHGFWNLQHVDVGYRPDHLLTFDLNLPPANYGGTDAAKSFWFRLQQRLSQMSGVQSATLMLGLPPIRPEVDNDTDIQGFVPVPNGPRANVAYYQIAGDRFFETLGARLMEGRFLEPRDGNAQSLGAVVNASMARTFWPHESAIGHRIRPSTSTGNGNDPWFTIVGVVADLKNGGVQKPAGTEVFFPYRAMPVSSFLSRPGVAIRTSGNPLLLAAEARRAVEETDSTLSLAKVRTMDDVIAASTSRPRFLAVVLGIFSVVALALATVGIYGIISYSVVQRTSEFGVKIALGAAPRKLLTQVVGQGMVLGFVGVAFGLVLAIFLTKSLEGLLYGVSRLDTSSFLATVAIMILAAAAASFLPAVRAMRIEPVQALRYE
jgi:putative ABC transport system permease protein